MTTGLEKKKKHKNNGADGQHDKCKTGKFLVLRDASMVQYRYQQDKR